MTPKTLPIADGNCIVNRKFLFWKWKAVEHDFQIYSLGKFMRFSKDFILTHKCSRCGATEERSFVTRDELMLMGIDLKIIDNIGEFDYYFEHP